MKKNDLTKRIEFDTLKPVHWFLAAKNFVSSLPDEVRRDFGFLIYRLQRGDKLGMPYSRPMNIVSSGVSELRVRGLDGHFRLMYFTKSKAGIFVFHGFIKKTQTTSIDEIKLGRSRLKDLLENGNE